MGCKLAQGFYISRPLDAARFPGFWRRHQAQPDFEPTDVGTMG